MSAVPAFSLPARHGLTLLSAQRWASTLAVVFAFSAAAAGGDLGAPLVGLFALSVLGALLFGDRAAHKLAWAWTAALILALAAIALEVFLGEADLVLGAARFAVLLAIHRLWNRASERDELLLLLLSLLLLCAGAALSASIVFAIAFAGYTVCGTWALALTHLRFQIEAGRGLDGSQALLRSKRLVTPTLLAALAGLSLVGLLGALVLFFAFPRVSIGSWHRPGKPRAVAGLSDRIDLTGQGLIQDDPSVVLRVHFEPDPGTAGSDAHFRARTFEVWTGRGWRSRGTTPRILSSGQLPLPTSPRARVGGLRLVEIEAVAGYSDGVILTPPGFPLSVRFDRPRDGRAAPQRLLRDAAGDLFYSPQQTSDLHYLVVAKEPQRLAEALQEAGTVYPAEVALDLEVPHGLDPRVRALSAQLTRGKKPAAAAASVEQWLARNIAYTRELPGDVKDPIADFLFEHRRGHCELFASAMVLLLRTAGIPARNVSGYYGGIRTGPGQYAVRAGDAHSWVEVYFPGIGFATYDPTPPSLRGADLSGLWPRAVLFWDGLASRWRSSVVDYDLLAQAQFLKRASALLQEANRRLSGKASGATRFGLGWAALLGGTLLCALAALVLRARRARASAGSAGARRLAPDQARARLLWQKARQELARAGVPLSGSTTACEAAAQAGGDPLRRQALAELSSRYLAARWGGAGLPAPEARRMLRALRRSL
jgi:transglutaminase-like putative cysteine protease